MASFGSFLRGVGAQINPFDRGRTFSTVQRDEEEKRRRAQQLLQGTRAAQALRINVARPAQNVKVESPQQAPRIRVTNLMGGAVVPNRPPAVSTEEIRRNTAANQNAFKQLGTALRDTGVDFARSVPRGVVSLASSVAAPIVSRISGKQVNQFETKDNPVLRIALGGDPIKTLQARRAGQQQTIEESRFRNVASPLSFLGAGLAGALDAPGLGPAGKFGKKLIRQLADETTSTGIKNITKKVGINLGDDAVEGIRKLKDPVAIRAIIESDLKNPTIRLNLTGLGRQPEELYQEGAPAKLIQGKAKKDPDVKRVLNLLSRSKTLSDVEASTVANRIKLVADEVGVKLNKDFINRYQSGKLSDEAERLVGQAIKQETDRAFQLQRQIDPAIAYRQNYLPQAYEEPEEVIRNALKVLQTRTGAVSPRKFESYAEASEYGLKPKYKSAEQMVATNIREATEVLGNREAIEAGLKSGVFTANPKSRGLAAVEGFNDRYGNQIFADKKVADLLNGALQRSTSGPAVAARIAARLSGGAQNIALTGGYKHYNFFTLSQANRDVTRNIGTFFTGRPIQSLKQTAHLVGDFWRSGTPERTAQRAVENADFIRDLAKNGLEINFQSSLTNAEKNLAARGFNKLFQNSTFARYLPNRSLSMAQEVYTQAVKKNMGHDEAIKLAADTTKQFMGYVDYIAKGRNLITQDLSTAALFAPRYREGIINSLVRTLRSVADPRTFGDKSFRPNRELATGMVATYIAMNELNRKLNGHAVDKNRKGQEFTSLQIPYGEKDDKGRQPVINIPFMPGYATIPRALFGAIRAAGKGDNKEFLAQVSKFGSIPVQTTGRVIANQQYNTEPIYISEKIAEEEGVEPDTGTKKAGKIASYIFGQHIPSYGRGIQKFLQGKPVVQAISEAAEAPLRFGKVPNKDTEAYFKFKDEARKPLNKNKKAVFDQLFPAGKNILGEDIKETNPGDRIEKATLLRSNPDVFKEVSSMYQKLNRETGQAIDPVYTLDWNKAQNVLWARSLPPGESSETKGDLLYNQPWYKQFHAKEIEFYNSLEKKLGKRDDPYNYPVETPKLNDLQERYHKLRKGTGERKRFLQANPQLLTYWDERRQATNRHRVALGLPPLDEDADGFGSGFGFGGPSAGASAINITNMLGKIGESPLGETPRIKLKNVKTVKIPSATPTRRINVSSLTLPSRAPTFGGRQR